MSLPLLGKALDQRKDMPVDVFGQVDLRRRRLHLRQRQQAVYKDRKINGILTRMNKRVVLLQFIIDIPTVVAVKMKP